MDPTFNDSRIDFAGWIIVIIMILSQDVLSLNFKWHHNAKDLTPFCASSSPLNKRYPLLLLLLTSLGLAIHYNVHTMSLFYQIGS